MEKIYKTKTHLVIKVPLFSRRYNPYDDKYHGKMDNIIGVIETENKERGWIEMGFAYRIDMDYWGKDDQWTDFFYKFNGDQKEFEKLCKVLGIGYVIT